MNTENTGGRTAGFTRRGVVTVSGPDAEGFLNNIVSSDVPAAAGEASYGGLLSPQGKVLFDFIVFRDGDRFLFDLPRASVAEFVKRLFLYRLRAKVEIAPAGDLHVIAGWAGAPLPAALAAADPRLSDLGWRAISSEAAGPNASETEYDAHRIALGVPEGGIDFAYGEAFPHDADMDQLAGIDFKKGCYVGQEVVSRMEHRGTARRRIVNAASEGPLPPAGTPVTAGGRAIGTLGGSVDGRGLALVRLDRAREAMDAGTVISAADTPLALSLPPWARFAWPAGAATEAE